MSKKVFLFRIIIFMLVFAFLIPSFSKRIYFENKNKGITLSLDCTPFVNEYEKDKFISFLSDAFHHGINTLTVNVTDDIPFKFIEETQKFDLALFIDAFRANDKIIDDINYFISRGNVKYINLKGEFSNENYKTGFLNFLSQIISKNNLILVFSETKEQNANDICSSYDTLLKSADGALMRCYDTSYSANDLINPSLRHHQMLNSLKDRNTHFINLVPFNEKEAGFNDNFDAMLMSVDLFFQKAESSGYNFADITVDFDGYNPPRAFNLMLSFILCVLLWHMIFELLFLKSPLFVWILAGIAAFLGAIGAFVFTNLAMVFYPMLLAISSSSFIITIILYSAKKFKSYGFVKSLLITLVIALFGIFLRGYSLAALLSGTDYYMYFSLFKGVKVSLFVPLIYAVFAFVKIHGAVKVKLKDLINKKNIIFACGIFAFLCVILYFYILRSGNSKISMFETNIRNAIDTIMGVRARTKEFLIGWPSLVLFVWFLTCTHQRLIPFLLSVGIAVLSSSAINSFCHVFTPCAIIYLRTFNGFALGMLISILLLPAVYIVMCKVIKKDV